MGDPAFARIVTLACHDLRTPLATVSGFAKTAMRTESAGFAPLIDAAADELAALLRELGVAAEIEAGTYAPELGDADTLELATSADERIAVTGSGATIRTDAPAIRRSLEALAVAAARHGGAARVSWTVDGRELELAPVTADAAAIVTGEELRDFGAIVARRLIEALGGSLALDGETLRVRL